MIDFDGRAATMRRSSVDVVDPSSGTLKSTRTSTALASGVDVLDEFFWHVSRLRVGRRIVGRRDASRVPRGIRAWTGRCRESLGVVDEAIEAGAEFAGAALREALAELAELGADGPVDELVADATLMPPRSWRCCVGWTMTSLARAAWRRFLTLGELADPDGWR
ncbi:MAG: hypothetical protein R3B49_08490 [Phycisphaerales bacterium]